MVYCLLVWAAPYFNTRVIGHYVDKHLLIPLLAFVREQNDTLGVTSTPDTLPFLPAVVGQPVLNFRVRLLTCIGVRRWARSTRRRT
eukprot:SAG25_NODE_5_length_29351_cov_43.404335_24_plen_86_part_00